uniref:Cytochrome P450 n=1 Tax=Daucus carota subsp. sativus TaxID=79200 RepID=A0A166E3K3_DAUCS
MDFPYAIFTIIATLPLLLLICFFALLVKIFTRKSIGNPAYPPVAGTVLSLLINFNRIYDYLTELAAKHQTFRLLAEDQSEIYTTEGRNIEHILKSSFDKYNKGQYLQGITNDLLGQGIFVVDGASWRQQRKLASVEFSTRMLRDFSCNIFRKNAVKLIRAVSQLSLSADIFDIQELLMRYSLDSIFEVGFGTDLNCMESDSAGSSFIKAFDDATSLIYWRYIDPTWKVQRLLNIGFEASLAKNVKYIHAFVQQVISKKRGQMEMQQNAGPRMCLGKDFAYRQMKIVSVGLLRYFRFKLADEKRAVTYKPTFTLHVDGGLHLLAISRPD